ncbi:MAG TPA: hypothetical protein DDZ44_08930 [Syntrophomonas wolfei]|uniref:Polysaccharide biosynthesis protein CapD-like domain-containing protein n=1 Tax=Syntrophomonas wolfei TaxID=863 RepID=A0A354YXG3_9FIRM|nr:hypothetical protein [Syntrophomonas wolfei]
MLVVLDYCENNLFDIEQELIDLEIEAEIAMELLDVKHRDTLEDTFRKYLPQIIFHAAAYKHVPIMERHPQEALYNNVLGTRNVAELADKYGAESFILISTDKAVNPTSVMGATKRIAELIIKDINLGSATRFAAVRFGNVLGSRGSVIPTFKKQIERGGPVTITHQDMKRYFMTIPEAVQLVLRTGFRGERAEIYVLDMGDPVSILELAENMISLSGYVPYHDIDIVEIGLRPGEKLYEELLTNRETIFKTEDDRIYIDRDEEYTREQVKETLNLLKNSLQLSDENQAVRNAMMSAVSTYHLAEEVNQAAEDSMEMRSASGNHYREYRKSGMPE